jgi:hypothetical protein
VTSKRRPARRGGTRRPTNLDDLFAPTPDLRAQFRAEQAEWDRAVRESELERRIHQLERQAHNKRPSALVQRVMSALEKLPERTSYKEAAKKLADIGINNLSQPTWNRARRELRLRELRLRKS